MNEGKTTKQLNDLHKQFTREIEDTRDSALAARRDLTAAEMRGVDRKFAGLDQIQAVLDSRPSEHRGGAPAIAFPAVEARSIGDRAMTRSWGATAKGQLRQEMTYRPDRQNETP